MIDNSALKGAKWLVLVNRLWSNNECYVCVIFLACHRIFQPGDGWFLWGLGSGSLRGWGGVGHSGLGGSLQVGGSHPLYYMVLHCSALRSVLMNWRKVPRLNQKAQSPSSPASTAWQNTRSQKMEVWCFDMENTCMCVCMSVTDPAGGFRVYSDEPPLWSQELGACTQSRTVNTARSTTLNACNHSWSHPHPHSPSRGKWVWSWHF
jgi:hypothetical protein